MKIILGPSESGSYERTPTGMDGGIRRTHRGMERMEEWNEQRNGIMNGERTGAGMGSTEWGEPRNGTDGEVGLPHGRKNGMNTQKNEGMEGTKE